MTSIDTSLRLFILFVIMSCAFFTSLDSDTFLSLATSLVLAFVISLQGSLLQTLSPVPWNPLSAL